MLLWFICLFLVWVACLFDFVGLFVLRSGVVTLVCFGFSFVILVGC